MPLVFVVIVLIGLFLNHIIAKAFEKIVFAKGYGTELKAYHMCFWLGIIGYLYVIALPNIKFERILLKHQKRMLELLSNSNSTSDELTSAYEEID